MRYLIKFTKEGCIKFISHLDLMRTIQRAIKRSELPIKYSKGFNPHMAISIAQPLSVGMYSDGEYMDIELDELLDEKYVVEKLNDNMPCGIKVVDAVFIEEKENTKKLPQSMAAVKAAQYTIKIRYDNTIRLLDELNKLNEKDTWQTLKESKNVSKEIDIKHMVKKIEFAIDNNLLIVKAFVSCGSKENLSAQLLAKFIVDNTFRANKDDFIDIKRDELYTISKGKYMPLYKYFKLRG